MRRLLFAAALITLVAAILLARAALAQSVNIDLGAAGQAAGVVRPVDPRPGRVAALDHVVDLGSEQPGLREPEPELHALHARDAHDRARQHAVEAPVPANATRAVLVGFDP